MVQTFRKCLSCLHIKNLRIHFFPSFEGSIKFFKGWVSPHLSGVMCNMSQVTRSHVRCTFFFFFFQTKLWGYESVEGLLSMGLPRLVLLDINKLWSWRFVTFWHSCSHKNTLKKHNVVLLLSNWLTQPFFQKRVVFVWRPVDTVVFKSIIYNQSFINQTTQKLYLSWC